MALNDLPPDLLIKRLGGRTDWDSVSMIRITETISSTVLQNNDENSSLGHMDALPVEVLYFVLSLLDFRSLSRISRVCCRWRRVTESLPAYRDLTKHASTALIALSRTKLISFHSAASIYSALLFNNCVSCENYGPYLFLPTCERCCYQCLRNTPSLRVITIRTATVSFGISPKILRQIPAMFSIPGRYPYSRNRIHPKPVKLVSIKQAKELGISVHGSEVAMAKLVTLKTAGKLGSQSFTAEWLIRSLPSQHPDGQIDYRYAASLDDSYHGVASVEFPYLRADGSLEHGIWCRGCQFAFRNDRHRGQLDQDTGVPHIVLESQARSESEFLKHIMSCKQAGVVLQKIENGQLQLSPCR